MIAIKYEFQTEVDLRSGGCRSRLVALWAAPSVAHSVVLWALRRVRPWGAQTVCLWGAPSVLELDVGRAELSVVPSVARWVVQRAIV